MSPSLDDSEIRTLLKSARALGDQLIELAENLDVSQDELVGTIAEAQGKLQTFHDVAAADKTVDVVDEVPGATHWRNGRMAASLPFAVIETDAAGRIEWASQTASSLLETSASRLRSQGLQQLVIDSDHMAVQKALTAEALESADHLFVRFTLPGDRTIAVELIPPVDLVTAPGGAKIAWIIRPASHIDSDGGRGVRIASAFAKLYRLSLDAGSPQEVMTRIAEVSEDLCAPQSSVSITVGPPAEPLFLGASTKFAQSVDACQMSANEGPCQLAWELGTIVYSDDALIDSRWPVFAKKAAHTGLVSALAAPIRDGESVLGALNVYSLVGAAFGGDDMHVVEMLAEAIGAVLCSINENRALREMTQQLQHAMDSRELIEQAKGVLMARFNCSAEEAFERLKHVSQNKNVRVRTLAEQLLGTVDSAALDGEPQSVNVTP